jgi:hypothetical protein
MDNSQPSGDPLLETPEKAEEEPPIRTELLQTIDNGLNGCLIVSMNQKHWIGQKGVLKTRNDVWNVLLPEKASLGIAPDDRESIRTMRDEFHYDIRPGKTMMPDSFLQWAHEMNSKRSPDDTRVFVYLGPDGSVHGVTERFESAEKDPPAIVVKHNHHDPLDLPDTPSSSMQLLQDLERGHFIHPTRAKRTHVFHTYLDNHDQDVCSYIWLVENWRKLVTNPEMLASVKEFMKLQDILDINAGLVPVSFDATDGPEKARADLVRQNMWVFQPYDNALKGNDLDSQQMMDVIREVGERIDAFVRGEAQLSEVDTQVVMIAEGDGWCMFDGDASGKHARFELCKDHRVVIRASITKNGTYHYGYSIGQVSDAFLPNDQYRKHANLNELSQHLNQIEGIHETDDDKWGGRWNVIGPPKMRKSALSPEPLIEELLKFYS